MYTPSYQPINNPYEMARNLAMTQTANRFQPMYPQQNYSYSQDYGYPQNRSGGLKFVNSKESAEAYYLPPNSQDILFDKNRPRFYIKETDASGAQNIHAYDFFEVDDTPQPNAEYVTRQEFDEWKKNYEPTISTTKPEPVATTEPSSVATESTTTTTTPQF